MIDGWCQGLEFDSSCVRNSFFSHLFSKIILIFKTYLMSTLSSLHACPQCMFSMLQFVLTIILKEFSQPLHSNYFVLKKIKSDITKTFYYSHIYNANTDSLTNQMWVMHYNISLRDGSYTKLINAMFLTNGLFSRFYCIFIFVLHKIFNVLYRLGRIVCPFVCIYVCALILNPSKSRGDELKTQYCF